jgi:hypothetical protein
MPSGVYIHKPNQLFCKGNKITLGYRHTPEAKIKIALASAGNKNMLGKKHTIETKTKISEASKKHWKDGLMVSGMLGKHHSEETKRKIVEGRKWYKPSKEICKKISEKNKGKLSWNKGTKGVMKVNSGSFKKGLYGKNSPHWKGGITSEGAIIRSGIEIRLWRESVFARDNWTCQKYGIKGGKLQSHHIQNFAQYPELRFAIDNGITLSDKAHREFHRKYGIKNNTKEQLLEFLNN